MIAFLNVFSIGCQAVRQPEVRFGVIADPQYTDGDTLAGRNYRAGKTLISQSIERFNQETDLDFICNLGDIVDGRHKQELPEVLALFKASRFPVKHTPGNHNLVLQSDEDMLQAYGVKSFNEEFKIGKIRFVLLHSMEVSLMRPRDSEGYKTAENTYRHTPRGNLNISMA